MSIRDSIHVRLFLVALLASAYLSTWSAALLQTLVLPSLGSGSPAVSSPCRPTQEKPAIVLKGRRHMPMVKTAATEAPPPVPLEYPRILAWASESAPRTEVSITVPPLLAPRQGRAPPAC